MNRAHRLFAPLFAALLLAGLAGEALAAPAPGPPTYSATMTADRKCNLVVSVTWKNDPGVAQLYVSFWEAGYNNPELAVPEYVVSYAYPTTSPNTGVQKGKVVTFTFGPLTKDSASHDWWAYVDFYTAGGAAITQLRPTLTTNCYLASPA